jgi:hypothetical protein
MISLRLARFGARAAGALGLVLLAAGPAFAQYGRPTMSSPAVGEEYHIEAAVAFWFPTIEATVSSESLGIVGDEIDLKSDLGYEDKNLREFRLVLRPGRKHKFRVAYLPMSYDAETVLERTIVFNGIAFQAGLPVESEFKWNTWRFGYEYDFLYRDRGYFGFLVEVRYIDAELGLRSPIDDEFTQASGPVPAVGLVFRGYPARNFSITVEGAGAFLPSIDDYEGSLFDLDAYGTLNFTNNVGAQFGYRYQDVSYTAELDTGDMTLDGFYFTGVVRF